MRPISFSSLTEVLSKAVITRWLLPYLPVRPGGRRAATDPAEVVGAICYKLKTGCQWRWLPVKVLFAGEPLSLKQLVADLSLDKQMRQAMLKKKL